MEIGMCQKGVDWDECVVTHVGTPVSLPCSDWSVAGTLQAHWLWKPLSGESWLPVVSASERLADKELSSSGKFSLTFRTGFQDAGRYTCQGSRQEGSSRPSGRVTLLIIVSITGSPMPVPTDGTLRLSARVSDQTAKVSWISPKGTPLHCREDISGSVLAKLPRVTWQEQGNYSCQVLVPGAPGQFVFNYTVTVRESLHTGVRITGPGSLYTEITVNRSHSAPWQGKEGNYSCTVTVAGQGRYTAVYALTLPPAGATDPLQRPAGICRHPAPPNAEQDNLYENLEELRKVTPPPPPPPPQGICRHPAPPNAEQDNLYENLEELRKVTPPPPPLPHQHPATN
ncbi:UNVERIFIED_CONTAM: hypothetical protein FKN15_004759 [Acipenser sinensis]